MYLQIERGKSLDIQGLNCWIPPEGYVIDIKTGELSYRGIWSRSDVVEEQYWERTPLPEWYKKKSKEQDEYERKRKDDAPPYYDEQLNEYIKQEWDRRLNGFWFMNNGNPVYLTGLHYMFLQWWQIDIGYGRFRMPDLDYFYFLQYCIEDPNCLGALEITKRRFGKTYRAGLFLYEYVSRTKNANAGIQSKTGGDAKKVFSKAVISPFKRLPKFFRPEYDTSLGITPKTEIRFQQTNIRGKAAESVLDKDELGSMIDHQSADVVAYDGQKLHRYVGDETAKTVECNVYDRHNVIRYCLLDDEGKIIGKALYCTTVEKMETENESVQKAFKQLWDDSDQNNRKENGRTASGLYRFFMTADRGRNIDIYGEPDVPKTIEAILSDRKSVEHNPRALSSLIRKEARTISEAFRADGDKCLFNSINLENRRDFLSWNNVTKRGNLRWVNGERFGKVEWVDDEKGFWEKWDKYELPDNIKNNISKQGNVYYPMNNSHFAMALDPYESDVTEDNRRSMAASLVKQKTNLGDVQNEFINSYIFKYYGRRPTAALMFEDIIMQCIYLGCGVLVENNKDGGIVDYFRQRGFGSFLVHLPGYKDSGIPSTPDNKQSAFYFMEEMVERNCEKIPFQDLIEDLLEFDIKNTQKFDLSMAALWTEMAAFNKMYSIEVSKNRNVEDFIPYTKAS